MGIQLSEEEAREVLTMIGDRHAPYTANVLAKKGYALVAVSGPALELAIERGDLESLPPAAPEQAERIEAWCDPARSS